MILLAMKIRDIKIHSNFEIRKFPKFSNFEIQYNHNLDSIDNKSK